MDYVLFCKLERGAAVPDYGDAATCTLLTGVEQADFSSSAFETGVRAHVVETPIDLLIPGLCDNEDCPCRTLMLGGTWMKLTLVPNKKGETWVYRVFSESEPERYDLRYAELVGGPELPDFPEASDVEFKNGASDPYSLSGFEVGQGMASIVYNSSFGYIVDAGAGTPIKRPNYCAASFVSDLLTLVSSRTNKFFLSHADSDHWRMLVWDNRIERHVTEFFVPSGMKPLAFFDVNVKSRTRSWSAPHLSIQLYSGQYLEIMRTDPATPTSNNDGLILMFKNGAELGLMPGDCVYDEMSVDLNTHVSALLTLSYAAIVVPHHGDAASATGIPKGSSSSKAFFSAGNHAGYRHPTAVSINAHSVAGYRNLINTTHTRILQVPLI